jgi:hypothetical protein
MVFYDWMVLLALGIRILLFVLFPEYYLVSPQVQLYWDVSVLYA